MQTAEAGAASLPRRGFRAAYAAAFLSLTVLYGAVLLATGISVSQAARNGVASILPNAALGLVALRFSRRLTWRRDRIARVVAAHALLLLALAALATAGWIALGLLDSWVTGMEYTLPRYPVLALFQALISGLVQLAVLGAGHAWNAAQHAARAEALRSRAELALLRSQVNPHFLMNTLHALLGLVRREPDKAEAALERLGELLRFGLHVHHAHAEEVAFREEWAFVTGYLALEQLRLGERLRVTTDADAEVMDLPVPPFALQPLVENAIIHAIASRREGGRLELRARRLDGRLVLEVEDDGPGTSEAAVLASPRLGLRLLRERLAVLYDGEARLAFEPAGRGQGLRVRLELPAAGPGERA